MYLDNKDYYVLLNAFAGASSTRLRKLITCFGGVELVCAATQSQLCKHAGLDAKSAKRLYEGCRNLVWLEAEYKRVKVKGIELITLDDAAYPCRLRDIHDPPLVLYIKGRLLDPKEIAIAIVGSRGASIYGLQSGQRLGYDLSLRGYSVVSGLARGIDRSAHEGALKGLGRTFAVLGNGLAQIYPPEHDLLASKIVAQGALITEYPMETPPMGYNFPRRNRIISGLSYAVVVVEAASRSGALITADCALEQGREVFAVPGPITHATSKGTNQLLKQGARLVTSVEDILEELEGAAHPVVNQPELVKRSKNNLDENERRVLECLETLQSKHIDNIATDAAVSPATVSMLLLQLELKDWVRQLPGKQYVKR